MYLRFSQAYLCGLLNCSWQPSSGLWGQSGVWFKRGRDPLPGGPWLLEGILGCGSEIYLCLSIRPVLQCPACFGRHGRVLQQDWQLFDTMTFVVLLGYSNREQWSLTVTGRYNEKTARRKVPDASWAQKLTCLPASVTLAPWWLLAQTVTSATWRPDLETQPASVENWVMPSHRLKSTFPFSEPRINGPFMSWRQNSNKNNEAGFVCLLSMETCKTTSAAIRCPTARPTGTCLMSLLPSPQAFSIPDNHCNTLYTHIAWLQDWHWLLWIPENAFIKKHVVMLIPSSVPQLKPVNVNVAALTHMKQLLTLQLCAARTQYDSNQNNISRTCSHWHSEKLDLL